MLRSTAVAIASLLISSAFPSHLDGQGRGLLTGTVTRIDKTPIENARVTVVGTDIISETRADGSYRLWGIPAGQFSLEVRMLGFAPGMFPFEIAAGATMQMPVVLVSVATPLDTVRVSSSNGLTPVMRGFEERRKRGEGKFFTMKDIAQMQARSFTDILRRAPGIQVQTVSGLFGNSDAVRSQRGGFGTRVCPVVFYINGVVFPMQQDFTINHFVSPEDVSAVEVYSGSSEIPPQFNSSSYSSRCGVVVIWTRQGIDPARTR